MKYWILIVFLTACQVNAPITVAPSPTHKPTETPTATQTATPTFVFDPYPYPQFFESYPFPENYAAPKLVPRHTPSPSPTFIKPTLTATTTGPCLATFPDPGLSLRPADEDGWCDLTLQPWGPDFVYHLIYPMGWTVWVAGAEGMNLMFNDDSTDIARPEVFLQLTGSDLPIEKADQATYRFELSGPDPLIDPGEFVGPKWLGFIGQKPVLFVNAVKDHLLIKHFFFYQQGENSYRMIRFLCMVRAQLVQAEAGSKAYAQLMDELEILIRSVDFFLPE